MAYNQQYVLQTIIALITGFVGLIAALPNIQAIVAAKTLGVLIFDVIERVPEIRNCPAPKSHYTLDHSINFNNVTFKYPTSLPEHKPVLIDATFSIKAGQATAIVGPSGSGKSTIVQLIERFYDPREGGSVDFDGQNLKQINLKTLRESIGYVSQEPVMIMGTIRDNLYYGNKDATEQDCIDALKQANATFV
jgi:ABC-type multidrug transport system fused ATPase/permease subunit